MVTQPVTPTSLLLEWLREDKAAGVPWSPEDFAQRVSLAVREAGGARSWRWALIDTFPAWRDAYLGRRSALARLSLDLLDDGDRRRTLDDPGY